jgi:multisubunit Na+/H+ antiporter MnhB subunit
MYASATGGAVIGVVAVAWGVLALVFASRVEAEAKSTRLAGTFFVGLLVRLCSNRWWVRLCGAGLVILGGAALWARSEGNPATAEHSA